MLNSGKNQVIFLMTTCLGVKIKIPNAIFVTYIKSLKTSKSETRISKIVMNGCIHHNRWDCLKRCFSIHYQMPFEVKKKLDT